MAIDVGSVLGETYEVTSLLGRGGMGAVWKAQHRRLPGKYVAVKVLLAEALTDSEVYARFRREAEIASRLGHPNIVEALDFNTLPDGTPYIVLELLQGETLASRLQRGPLALDAALAIVRQIGSGLYAAHRAGIVHRDLKPDNIFLTPNDSDGVVVDRVKILDFGISKIRDSNTVQTQASALLGTPQYMSPEQAAGRHAQVDARTDEFALAAIVYEMLSGSPAFGGQTLAEVVCKVMLEAPPALATLVPSLPPRVVNAVERALSKKAEERFPDLRSFVEELSGRPLMTLDAHGGAAPAPPVPAKTEQVRRSSAPFLVVGAVGVVALGAVALAIFGRASAPPVVAPVAAPSVVASPNPTPAPVAAPSVVPAPVAAAPVPVAAAPSPPSHVAPPSKPRVTEALPAEVVADLDAAESALGGGSFGEARRLARRTLPLKPSARAYAIVARSFCREGNLGDAKAQLAHLGAERARVMRECKAAGVDLE